MEFNRMAELTTDDGVGIYEAPLLAIDRKPASQGGSVGITEKPPAKVIRRPWHSRVTGKLKASDPTVVLIGKNDETVGIHYKVFEVRFLRLYRARMENAMPPGLVMTKTGDGVFDLVFFGRKAGMAEFALLRRAFGNEIVDTHAMLGLAQRCAEGQNAPPHTSHRDLLMIQDGMRQITAEANPAF